MNTQSQGSTPDALECAMCVFGVASVEQRGAEYPKRTKRTQVPVITSMETCMQQVAKRVTRAKYYFCSCVGIEWQCFCLSPKPFITHRSCGIGPHEDRS